MVLFSFLDFSYAPKLGHICYIHMIQSLVMQDRNSLHK